MKRFPRLEGHCPTINIYVITCSINKKRYVGQTSKTVEGRWKNHIKDALLGSSQYFHKAIRKYKPFNFDIRILAFAYSNISADKIEEFFIKRLKTCDNRYGYNIAPGGKTIRGFKHSNKTKEKMSLGQYRRFSRPEELIKLSILNQGKRLAEKHKNKISESCKNWYSIKENKEKQEKESRKIQKTAKWKKNNRLGAKKRIGIKQTDEACLKKSRALRKYWKNNIKRRKKQSRFMKGNQIGIGNQGNTRQS